jgi:hypothetical protein
VNTVTRRPFVLHTTNYDAVTGRKAPLLRGFPRLPTVPCHTITLIHAGPGARLITDLGSERRGREILRLALQARIDARGDGDIGTAIVVPSDHGPVRLARKRVHTRPVITLFGEVRVARSGMAPRDATRSIRSMPS